MRDLHKNFCVFTMSCVLLFSHCTRPALQSESRSATEIHSLYLSARKVSAAVETGVTFGQYSQILTDATAQLQVAQDSQPSDPKQQQVLARYSVLLEKYQDALYVWNLAIQGGKGDEPKLIAIQTKFGIRPGRQGNLFEDIRNQLWQQCASDVNEILPLLRSAGVI